MRAPVVARRETPGIAGHGLAFVAQEGATAPARYRLPAGAEEAVALGKKSWNRSMSSSGDVSIASSPTC